MVRISTLYMPDLSTGLFLQSPASTTDMMHLLFAVTGDLVMHVLGTLHTVEAAVRLMVHVKSL